jgi:hypothetical protein
MTEILDAIELELVGAVRRHNAGARRRRLKAVAGTALAALALGGAAVTATVVETPLDSLFPSAAEAPRPADERRATATVADDAGAGWSMIGYRTREGLFASALVRQPRPAGAPDVSGRSGLFLAVGARRGQLASVTSDVFEQDGRVHVAVGGTVDATVTSVAVLVDGARREATVSQSAVRVPVRLAPGERGTAKLQRLLPELPEAVELRTFAVALPAVAPPATAPERSTATVELTLGDGTVQVERHTICVSPRCQDG